MFIALASSRSLKKCLYETLIIMNHNSKFCDEFRCEAYWDPSDIWDDKSTCKYCIYNSAYCEQCAEKKYIDRKCVICNEHYNQCKSCHRLNCLICLKCLETTKSDVLQNYNYNDCAFCLEIKNKCKLIYCPNCGVNHHMCPNCRVESVMFLKCVNCKKN